MSTQADDTRNTDLLRAQAHTWDLVIIGGGITGAGILLEAVRRGYKALLVEQRDFAWGTSSRSSKLVHGGLRYLKEGQLGLTRDSVQERQRLLKEVRGLVDPQSFAFADYRGRKPGRWLFQVGLALYDWMAGQRERHYHRADDFLLRTPHIGRTDLKGGMCYVDAKTDDARLVLRVLQQARKGGAVALNYLGAQRMLYEGDESNRGAVPDAPLRGVLLQDAITGQNFAVRSRLVVNATGAWADRLRQQQGAPARLRPLRGSHLVLPAWRLPVGQAVSLMHPRDGRPVFAFPWEGVTLIGTTDQDHGSDLQQEARITPSEVDYLLEALTFQFPELQLTQDDVLTTFAGVRPVVHSGKADPSQESRDHAVWMERGLLTVTGGKLTTFRLIAQDALDKAATHLPPRPADEPTGPWLAQGTLAWQKDLTTGQGQRLQGRYGPDAPAVLACAAQGELQAISGTETLWVELRWAARTEAVVHLEDLLLRRTRLGLLLRHGGAALLPRIRAICQPELGWTNAQWDAEQAAYLALWQSHYSLPSVQPTPPEEAHV